MKRGEFFRIVFLGTVLGALFVFLLALAVAMFPRAVGTAVSVWNERAIHVKAQNVGDPTSPSQGGLRAVMVCRDKKTTKRGLKMSMANVVRMFMSDGNSFIEDARDVLRKRIQLSYLNRLENLVRRYKEGVLTKAEFVRGLTWTVEEAKGALCKGHLRFSDFDEIMRDAQSKAIKHASESLHFDWTIDEIVESVTRDARIARMGSTNLDEQYNDDDEDDDGCGMSM